MSNKCHLLNTTNWEKQFSRPSAEVRSALKVTMAKKATNKPEAAQFSAAEKQRQREAALLSNQCARTKVLATGEDSSTEYTSVDEEGRMAFLIFLAGENLSRLDNLTWLTPGQAASALARAIISGLYRIRFSSRQDAVTRFIKGFLANGPEGRMKKYIRGIIAADAELNFRDGASAAEIRRRIVARAAARVNRAVTRRPVGQKLELVATSSNFSATNVAAAAAAAKAAAADEAYHAAAYMAAFWKARCAEVGEASLAWKAHSAEAEAKAEALAKKAEEAAAAAKAAEEAAAAAAAESFPVRDTALAEALKAAGLIR